MADAVQKCPERYEIATWVEPQVPPATQALKVTWAVLVDMTGLLLTALHTMLDFTVLDWATKHGPTTLEASGMRQEDGTSAVAKATPIDPIELQRLYLEASAIVLGIALGEITRREERARMEQAAFHLFAHMVVAATLPQATRRAGDEASPWFITDPRLATACVRHVIETEPLRPLGSDGFGG